MTNMAGADGPMSLPPNHPNGMSAPASENSAAGSSAAGAPGTADWLALAAAPAFAIMALLTAATSEADAICSSAHDGSPLTGMVAMYLLMSAFHAAPWLRLIAKRREAAGRGNPTFSANQQTGG